MSGSGGKFSWVGQGVLATKRRLPSTGSPLINDARSNPEPWMTPCFGNLIGPSVSAFFSLYFTNWPDVLAVCRNLKKGTYLPRDAYSNVFTTAIGYLKI